MPARIDVLGQVFGRLRAVSEGPRTNGGRRTVVCICECGASTNCEPRDLRSGQSKSCGCLQREAVAKTARSRSTHSMTGTTEYNTWIKIKGRCENPRDAKFADYGGRGIQVCKAWRDDFAAFFADMGRKPSGSHSIDRLDVNGPYAPWNCRWATPKEQSRNKRAHRMVAYHGRRMPLSEACELSGTNYRSALYRLNHDQPWMPLPPPPVSSTPIEAIDNTQRDGKEGA